MTKTATPYRIKMLDFSCDYRNGACQPVLDALIKTNGETTATYGFDVYSKRAEEKIKAACKAPDAEVFLIAGGTQTNMTVISSCLLSYGGARRI